METKPETKPMLGTINQETGNIKVMYKSEISGYDADSKVKAEMEALGLPINFEFGNQNHHNGSASKKLRTNKQKKTFWCNICKIELNSEDTMNSHMNGVKHMKKALTNAMASQPLQEIVPIPNPQATRKKIPLRLQQKILESSHVLVGLSFVKEYIACSNSEMEPHYGKTVN